MRLFADSFVEKPNYRMATAKISCLTLHKISRTLTAKFSYVVSATNIVNCILYVLLLGTM